MTLGEAGNKCSALAAVLGAESQEKVRLYLAIVLSAEGVDSLFGNSGTGRGEASQPAATSWACVNALRTCWGVSFVCVLLARAKRVPRASRGLGARAPPPLPSIAFTFIAPSPVGR